MLILVTHRISRWLPISTGGSTIWLIGNVVALDPGSRRFRVLYRRASMHNSFLVTERLQTTTA